MEGLPRAPHNGDRKVASRDTRQEQPYRQPEEPRISSEYASRVSRASGGGSNTSDRKSKKGLIWGVGIAVLVIGLLVGAWALFGGQKNGQQTGIDSGRYQAVFLSNGQIYFGKLQSFTDTTFKMTNIYYPQQTSADDSAKTDVQSQNNNIQLIRLGDEVHGPDNEMFLTKTQVLYYENLQANSKVSQLMDQNEKSR